MNSRLDKSAHFSKVESGWQVITFLGFIFLHFGKCFSILPTEREANKKQATSHQRTFQIHLVPSVLKPFKGSVCMSNNNPSQIPVPCSVLKIHNRSLERLNDQVSNLGDIIDS